MTAQDTSPVPQADPQLEAKVTALSEKLRCLVCKNQSIAESSAPLALDLRAQVREQFEQGKSEQQIREYMVTRYGDFVLYDPPFKFTTLILWLGPLAVLLGGLTLFILNVRRQSHAPTPPLSTQERAQAEALLNEKNL